MITDAAVVADAIEGFLLAAPTRPVASESAMAQLNSELTADGCMVEVAQVRVSV